MPISAVDTVTPAIEHTKQQLFRPFSFGQWARLALVGFFAGELSSGGGCNFQVPNFNQPHHRNFADLPAFPHWDPALLIPLILIAVIVFPILWLLFIYISSRMRFVLFDSVVEKKCQIGRMWNQRGRPAIQLFVWQIVIAFVSLGIIVILVGIPALFALLLGWFNAPGEHILGWVLVGIPLFFVLLCFSVVAMVVHVFTKDFVVPQMALEGTSAFEGWRRLLRMMDEERTRYLGYAGMKLVLAIGAAFFVGIATIILVIIFLIPVGGLGFLSVIFAKGAGLSWNAYTITLVIVAGSAAFLFLLYLVSLISVPVIVFFSAYSIHFFAARYPLLANLIYPPPPAPTMPEPPPMPPPEPLPGPAV